MNRYPVYLTLPGPDSCVGKVTVSFSADPEWQGGEYDTSTREGWIDTDCQSARVHMDGKTSHDIPVDLAIVLATIGQGMDPAESAHIERMGRMLDEAVIEHAEDARAEGVDPCDDD